MELVIYTTHVLFCTTMIGTKVGKLFENRQTKKQQWYDGVVTSEDNADTDGSGLVIYIKYSDGDSEWCVHFDCGSCAPLLTACGRTRWPEGVWCVCVCGVCGVCVWCVCVCDLTTSFISSTSSLTRGPMWLSTRRAFSVSNCIAAAAPTWLRWLWALMHEARAGLCQGTGSGTSFSAAL